MHTHCRKQFCIWEEILNNTLQPLLSMNSWMKINITSRKMIKDKEEQLRMAEDWRKAQKSFFKVSY